MTERTGAILFGSLLGITIWVFAMIFLSSCGGTTDVDDSGLDGDVRFHEGCPHTTRAQACADLSYTAGQMYELCGLGSAGNAANIIQQGHSCNDILSVDLSRHYDISCVDVMEECSLICVFTGTVPGECNEYLVAKCATLLEF